MDIKHSTIEDVIIITSFWCHFVFNISIFLLFKFPKFEGCGVLLNSCIFSYTGHCLYLVDLACKYFLLMIFGSEFKGVILTTIFPKVVILWGFSDNNSIFVIPKCRSI